MTEPVFIIAEAGVNHNGSLEIAKQMIDVAADAGADAVKFQTFKSDLLATDRTVFYDSTSAVNGRRPPEVSCGVCAKQRHRGHNTCFERGRRCGRVRSVRLERCRSGQEYDCRHSSAPVRAPSWRRSRS